MQPSISIILWLPHDDLDRCAAFSHSGTKVLWLTCGNTSNQNLLRILRSTLGPALKLLEGGEAIVEITGSILGR